MRYRSALAFLLSATVVILATSIWLQPKQYPTIEIIDEDITLVPEGWVLAPISRTGSGPFSVQFASDSEGVYITDDNGDLWLFSIRDDANMKGTIIASTGFNQFSVAPDHSKVVGIIDGELHLLDLATNTRDALGVTAKFIIGWNASGDSLYFSTQKGATFTGVAKLTMSTLDIHWLVVNIDDRSWMGENADEVVAVRGVHDIPYGWNSLSPDGAYLLFSAGHGSMAAVYRLSLESHELVVYPRTLDAPFAIYGPDGIHAIIGYGFHYLLNTNTGNVASFAFPCSGDVRDVSSNGRVILEQQIGERKQFIISPPGLLL